MASAPGADLVSFNPATSFELSFRHPTRSVSKRSILKLYSTQGERMSLFWMAIITLVILQTSVFFTTIYLHRCKTHRGVELNPVVGFLMHLELSLFTGVVPRQWAAVHRKHHHFSDEIGDPHSPYIYGLWTVLFGNYFFYKKEASDRAMVAKYTPDWKNDIIDPLPGMNYAAVGGIGIFMLM